MAKQQTSFSSEEAQILLRELQQFCETLKQEWSWVVSQWSNLKVTWHDEQFDRFEPLFEKMAAHYNDVERDCEQYIEFLQEQIRIADERKSALGSLDWMGKIEKTVAGVQIFSSLAGTAISAPTQRDPTLTERYQRMPGIARVMNGEQQFSEYYQQQQEAETKRKKRELEISSKADKPSQASGSPPKKHPPSAFAQSLNYRDRYGSWDDFYQDIEAETSARIEALLPDGREIGYINVCKQSDGRVYIQDTEVAKAYRKQGIGTLLFKKLEEKLPQGTQLYFITNDAPKNYWKNRGFKQVSYPDGRVEFCKQVKKEL
ncbi:MAG: GNAT family N-acetyltransferase [Roseofilum sp. SBFL]|uniref:GNAT family N-acetyltransferase n=1 Tax=unclassified Roseofilum TaxID=2620099 RepID=UPI001B1DB387|nr:MULTISPECIES: GNAT family N-acetyltransferase [unclassified Roseofilum]MBP0013396.1 GNAT family N-acetyltransferase [Roseofilum sp. SID3]MBP0024102.1 GNAT family N-acetyltransferase [Roseofilum sp. SID2]MBP0038862.1 GNAT family N-acetyltransferase [Roseofilum sp. SID1]MBP0041561.1 GNAT family N-acetyltransferase [Roseofilum sp. SBFL]